MIFISYRIADSNDLVDRLATDLMAKFGKENVFRDEKRIVPGQTWSEEIESHAKACAVMLVAIGKEWQDVKIDKGKLKGYPRLHDEQDWVRREIKLGLQGGKTVIPLLLNGAAPPEAEWLSNFGLQDLAAKQAALFRSDLYDHDLAQLVAALRKQCPDLPPPKLTVGGAPDLPVPVSSTRPESIDYYLRRLAHETASLSLLGMGRGLQIDLPIAEAYVPLRTMMARSMERRDTEIFKRGHAEHEEDVELGSVFHKAAHLGLRAVVLLGEPGSGKTTGARQMAWRLAGRQGTPQDLGLPAGMVPVFLRLRNLSRAALAEKKDGLRTFLEDETRCALAPDGQRSPANDLLLTILCIVFHDDHKLPKGRAELYAHCIRVFLDTWRHELYESEQATERKPYDARAAQDVLARVAWWMHQQQDRTAAPLADLAAEAAKGLVNVAANSGLGRDGNNFLERMRYETGILALAGEGRCGFLHLSFQEYLAAEHAAGQGFAKELASRASEKASESWWREVALLSLQLLQSSQPFCEKFVGEMLAAGIAENNAELAERCLNEARHQVLKPLLEALQQAPSNERQAAILRLLRDRAKQVPPDQLPQLEALCRRLADPADSADAQSRGFAGEILIQSGIQPPKSAGPTLFVDKQSGMTFVPIPAGEFRMGSERGDGDEKPIHRVVISRAFWLGKYPVTNAQFGRFLEVAGKTFKKPADWDDRRFNQPEQPVVGVTWDEARAFCEWAGGRLPTEAEWEYACRAGTTTEFSFGDDPKELGKYGWFDKNSGGQTQPVGAKKPNAWELHDMHGNVWEWCGDWYEADRYATKVRQFLVESARVSPQEVKALSLEALAKRLGDLALPSDAGPPAGSSRVLRGGSWRYDANYCRSAARARSSAGYRSDGFGFRVCRASGPG